VPPTNTPTSTATIQVGQLETNTPVATATTEVAQTATATATTDETGGENETPATSPTAGDSSATATQGVTDLPNTGMRPSDGGGFDLGAALLIALALALAGFVIRRRADVGTQ
jgi:hypothetical protein